MPRENLQKVDIKGRASYYVEDVESIKIFPNADKVEVVTQRNFFDSKDNLVRAESGVEFEVRHTLPEQAYNQIIRAIKQKRPA